MRRARDEPPPLNWLEEQELHNKEFVLFDAIIFFLLFLKNSINKLNNFGNYFYLMEVLFKKERKEKTSGKRFI